MTTFGASEVNDVLRVVRSMSEDGDIQLSILRAPWWSVAGPAPSIRR